MTTISVKPKAPDDAKIADSLDVFARRVSTTPPGMCPIALQLSLLETSGLQTCGKCVPCRDGIPQLAGLMRKILMCQATPDDLTQLRALADMVRSTSDCAIGYQAGQMVLDSLETFAAEYESHVHGRSCQAGVGQTVPCETNCPAHVNVPAYIALTGQGDYDQAINMIRKDNPFPTACALICEHPCEMRCRRELIDAPINIRGIKRFAVDQIAADQVPVPDALPVTGRRIAVIGGGPSGMTCAYFSALMGHSVDVFEGRQKLGGMMRYGIPPYRFPRERLDEDLRAILSAGNINVHFNAPVDADGMARIAQEYDAVYVAIGAQTGKTLRLENSDADGVISAVDMLGKIGEEVFPDFTGKRVVVIGGGNVAMDCARTSVRAGAKTVTVAYRRRIDDMTALRMEIDSAIAEGVEMQTLQSPDSIEVDAQGHCTALITQPQIIGPVKNGRPSPQAADKPKHRIPADIILIAVGQDIVSDPFEEFGMQTNRGRFAADETLKATGYDNIFVGGDCQTGPKTVIMAIGAGKAAARNIDEYLGYHHKLNCGVETPLPIRNDRTPMGRVNLMERPANERKQDFEGVEMEMSLEEAVQECDRCLRCDHFGCGALEGGRIQYV